MKQPRHGRKLVLGAVALTKRRNNRHAIPVLNNLRDQLEPILVSNGYFEEVPYTWISLIIRYGLVNAAEPVCENVSEEHGDLPASIEIRADDASLATKETLEKILRGAVVRVLIKIGAASRKDVRFLEDLLP